jgi:phosphoglycolate phosphatase
MTRVVLFDLDGTLIDPRVGIVRSLRHALERLARPCPPDEALTACIGPPLRSSFATLLATSDRCLIEQAMTLYRERFATVGLYENHVYDGVPAMLDDAASGGPLLVATSKPVPFAERILRHLALDHHFRRVYGPDLAGRLDDKTELLAHLLVAERLAGADCVMVGDRRADVIAARANGVRAIGALWGYGSRDELLGAGADALCAAPSELPATLAHDVGARKQSQ